MTVNTYTANIRIRDLPVEIDKIIREIAGDRNCHKWEVIRDAIIAYAENYHSWEG